MKGVIFDFNGTLYWDSQLHYDAWREYSKILRGTSFSDEEMQKYMLGHTNEDIIAYAIGRKPTKEMVEKYGKEKEALYRKRCMEKPSEFKLAPGAEDFLDFLKKNNIPRTIATMSEWDNVKFYIDNFHLENWFDIDKIIYSDGTIPGKPAPDIFLIASQKINILPNQCIVIEDAIAGINSAKTAGIGNIIAMASLEPIEFYKKIDGLTATVRNFDEINKELFI